MRYVVYIYAEEGDYDGQSFVAGVYDDENVAYGVAETLGEFGQADVLPVYDNDEQLAKQTVTLLAGDLAADARQRRSAAAAARRLRDRWSELQRSAERDHRDHPQKAACKEHLLDGHVWTCPACVNAEALRREKVMRRG